MTITAAKDDITPALARQFKLDSEKGALVGDVVPDGPGDKAGLKSGDLIVAINDQPALSPRVVTRQISVAEPGSDVKLKLLRKGEPIEVHATAGVRPPPPKS